MKDYLERCFKKDPNMVSRKIADEVILVPIRQNVGDLESIYTLNEVATRIWELMTILFFYTPGRQTAQKIPYYS